ncbi:MAG: hemolysin secretion protein D [Phenylobacterium sp. RIFCSPHIGHO2_01_FULL_69_31]|uniref:efflux RND transporter periplasmic adaptor subunit n=1 Tax=Phenylobacterium sp. RIFCSPHIGHO2_01_FULL_69_31 TaxID=1801944 RepID=UPI0008B7453C|nr:HlyD family efflux transporter periplasmic adaptor subunit [Phenylobacterium sp. RIFCSPHIGHO2_01_FULL_69_31]OHB28879.1 MAG: hemolysin secretion protein D [Phenylobacterium sp. RIFCSPHIGHO2_01_FULL_69_31]
MPALLRNRFVWIAVVLLLLGGGGAMFMSNQAKAKKAEETKAAAAVKPSPYAAIANGKADVEGGIIQVAARRAGVIRDVLVQEGDDVVKGQVLARLEDDEPRLAAERASAEVRQARAALALLQVQLSAAQREHRRLEGLAPSNFVAAQRLDQARDAVREAEARIMAQQAVVATNQARLNESRYDQELSIIRAPADGRIVRRYANPGAGASTLNVSNMFDVEPRAGRIVRAEIAEGSLPFVGIGQTVQMSPESDPTKVYPGKVLRRAAVFGARKLQSDDPTERTDDRVVEVVVDSTGAPFLIGQRVLVKFVRGQQQAQTTATPRS